MAKTEQTHQNGAEAAGVSGGIAVAEIIEEAGLADVIYIPDAPALLADFGTDGAVRYNYGWWGGDGELERAQLRRFPRSRKHSSR